VEIKNGSDYSQNYDVIVKWIAEALLLILACGMEKSVLKRFETDALIEKFSIYTTDFRTNHKYKGSECVKRNFSSGI